MGFTEWLITIIIVSIFIDKFIDTIYEENENRPIEEIIHRYVKPKSEKQIRELFEQVGAEIMDVQDDRYTVKYQGGVFLVFYNPYVDSVCLLYRNFFELLDFEYEQQALIAINIVNSNAIWWIGCLTTEEKDLIRVSLSYTTTLYGKRKAIVATLRAIMQNAFETAREFSDAFEEKKQYNSSTLQCNDLSE